MAILKEKYFEISISKTHRVFFLWAAAISLFCFLLIYLSHVMARERYLGGTLGIAIALMTACCSGYLGAGWYVVLMKERANKSIIALLKGMTVLALCSGVSYFLFDRNIKLPIQLCGIFGFLFVMYLLMGIFGHRPIYNPPEIYPKTTDEFPNPA